MEWTLLSSVPQQVPLLTPTAATIALALLGAVGCSMASGQEDATIVDEWASVPVPPAPELKPVTVSAQKAALLILDIQKQNCNSERRPRCVASLARIKRLLDDCRNKGMPVVYSLTSNASEADILEQVAPRPGEPVVKSGVDKFFGTDLEEILKSRGVETVILVGTSAHGAVLNTATGAALRGFEVVVPVDGMSASEPYAEQYTAWHLANSPGTQRRTALTRISMIEVQR
jgi:nicotinamidase-related amidase